MQRIPRSSNFSAAMDAVVEFGYEAQNDDELTIRVGDVIGNCAPKEDGWMEGEIRGVRGVFPDNFVKVVKTKNKAAVPQPSTPLDHKNMNAVDTGSSPATRKEKKRKAKVIFSYLPENADELRLDNGDVVTILDQEEEGWLRGLLHGKEGVFPSNFVEEISDSDVEEVTEKKDKEKEKTENETDSHKEKKRVPGIKGPGFGDIFSQGPIKLKSTGGASDRKVSPEVAGGAGDRNPSPEPVRKNNKQEHKVPPKKPPPPAPVSDGPVLPPRPA